MPTEEPLYLLRMNLSNYQIMQSAHVDILFHHLKLPQNRIPPKLLHQRQRTASTGDTRLLAQPTMTSLVAWLTASGWATRTCRSPGNGMPTDRRTRL